MKRSSVLLALVALVGIVQTVFARQISDSLVDVFPLAIGNQWTYGYDYDWNDPPGAMYHLRDTGSVQLHVINLVTATDSNRWTVQETSTLWQQYNDGSFYLLPVRTDTFEIVEFPQGNHRLYRTGDLVDARLSVLPVLPSFGDTSTIYRFAAVNEQGFKVMHPREHSAANMFALTFTRGMGLSSVQMSDGCLCFPYYGTSHVLRSAVITDVPAPPEGGRPGNYLLHQNYPNPFNPSTMFSWSLPSRAFVSLKVFDLLGREVATVVSAEMEPGSYFRPWDASGLAGGVYFYRLQAGPYSETRKLILSR